MATVKHVFGKLLAAVFLLASIHASAGREDYYTRMSVPEGLAIGANINVDDYRYNDMISAPSLWGFKNKEANGWVEAGVDLDKLNYTGAAFTYTLIFTCNYSYHTGSAWAPGTPAVCSLKVSYDPNNTATTFQDKAIFKIPNAHRLRVQLTGVLNSGGSPYAGALPVNVYAEAKVEVERYYNFQHWVVPAYLTHSLVSDDPYKVDGSSNPVKTEIEVKWDYVLGAEEYQLEYAFVGDYKGTLSGSTEVAIPAAEIGLTENDFKLNCTRVTTTNQHYRIPIVFERGYLVYRLRGVGRGGPTAGDYSKYIFGKWTTDNGVSKTRVSHFPHKLYIDEYLAHHEYKNWQHIATFAEEGKRKDVISYYDGSLRNRQTVTKINSDNNAVAGETIYDYEGRGALSVLPVPTGYSVLRYYPDMNMRTGLLLSAYTRKQFDADGSGCSPDVEAMRAGYGAVKYYSSGNSITHSHRDFIANANAYPFSVTEYMPDNTGRVRSQSGVGSTHKTGSGHETQYFYGQPDQVQLDRIFASDVGNAQHYKKTLAVDANGQVSITYLDMQSNVIATALAGDNPANLANLANPNGGADLYDPVSVTVDLLNKDNSSDVDDNADNNHMSLDGKELNYSAQRLVVGSGTYQLHYTLDNTKYTDECLVDEVCYPLVYDLHIGIKDLCGTEKCSTAVTKTVNGSYTSTPVNCSSTVAEDLDNTDGLIATLSTGSYTIEKTLKVNEAALDYYAQRYIDDLDTINCFKTLYDFEQELMPDIEAINCPVTCEQCSTALGSRNDYVNDITAYPEGDSEDFEEERGAYYDALLEACMAPCKATTLCETRYNMLLADVSPNGQYGSINSSDPNFLLSVFNPGNMLPGVNGNLGTSFSWNSPSIPSYRNDDGLLSTVAVVSDGAGGYLPPINISATPFTDPITGELVVYPQELANLNDFLDRWQTSWAKSLVLSHPEYGYYAECIKLSENISGFTYSAEEFELALNQNSTYSGSTSTDVGAATSIDITDPANDPLFDDLYDAFLISATSIKGRAFTKLNNAVNNYQGTGYSMEQMASITANCGTTYGPVAPGCITPMDTDAEWQQFKNYYLSERQRVLQEMWDETMIDDYVGSSHGDYHYYNGCIGENPFSLAGHPSGYVWLLPTYVSGTSYFHSWLISGVYRPCAFPFYTYYHNKARRFYIPDLSDEAANADYYAYQQTGLCPVSLHVQGLLNHMAGADLLDATAEPLLGHAAFTPLLYEEISGIDPIGTASPYLPYQWQASGSGSTLTINIANASPACTSAITLTLPAGSGLSWSGYPGSWSIDLLTNIFPIGSSAFTMLAYVDDDNNGATPPVQVLMNGTTAGCLPLDGCSFQECRPSEFSQGVESFFNTLSGNGALSTNISNIHSNINYSYFYNTYFKWYLGTSGTANLVYTAPDKYKILHSSGNYLEFDFSIGTAFAAASVFSNVNHHSSFAPPSVNTGVDLDVNGTATTIDVKWYVAATTTATYLPGGECGEPVPLNCQSLQHNNTEALLNLLKGFANGDLEPDDSNDKNILTGSPYWGSVFQNQLATTYTQVFVADGTITSGLFNIPIKLSGDYGDEEATVWCTIELHKPVSLSSYNFTTITDFRNLQPDYSGPMIGGYPTEFTIEAFNGSIWQVLRGSSCFQLAGCNSCVPVLESAVDCHLAYDEFIADENVQTLGLDDDYTEQEFCDHGFASCMGLYIGYLAALPPSYLPYADNIESFCSIGAISPNAYLYFDYMDAMGYPLPGEEGYISISDFLSAGYNAACVEAYIESIADQHETRYTLEEYCADMPVELPCTQAPQTGPLPPVPPIEYDPCAEYIQGIINQAMANAHQQYEQYVNALVQQFRKDYIDKCMKEAVETLTLQYDDAEYHYTLYYYDLPGNLVRTVPPQGVTVITSPTDLANIKADRAANTHAVVVQHKFPTSYEFNSLNQLKKQITPDAGTSNFWYDRLGRMVVSQNAKQQPGNFYSYTTYDGLGRILHAGQAYNTTAMSNATALNDASLASWISAATKTEVNWTLYDVQPSLSVDPYGTSNPENLRNRIAAVVYQDTYNATVNNATPSTTTYVHATHYSYDIHGDVKTLVQEFPRMGVALAGQEFKTMQYSYDLISGNVNEVKYQPGKADQFYHQYWYDSDNRITNAFTSHDYVNWDQEAKYFYYPHGPLARTETGHHKVQGTDYAYTLQGWLKGINSNTLNVIWDPGTDSRNTVLNVNRYVAKDAYSYSLGYYNGDYSSIAATSFIASIATPVSSYFPTDAPALYNGNINHMVTTLTDIDPSNGVTDGNALPQLTAYKYDQLNRLKQMKAYRNLDMGMNEWGNATGYNNSYEEAYKYDHNGNIVQQKRNGLSPNLAYDDLKYYYYTASGSTYDPQGVATPSNATNKLAYVDDPSSEAYTDDMNDQASGNYTYDAIGQLIGDVFENTSQIQWTVKNKVKKVIRTANTVGKPTTALEFVYDAMGHRVAKIAKPWGKSVENGGSDVIADWTTTFYILDATGNVMATYSDLPAESTVRLTDRNLYGSSQVGVLEETGTGTNMNGATVPTTSFVHTTGLRTYEMSNHLGNILTTVLDKHVPQVSGSVVIGYKPYISTINDYGSFGPYLAGTARKQALGGYNYDYGFNGKRKDYEMHNQQGSSYDFDARLYNSRLGRWMSVDPKVKHNESPYTAFTNSPIWVIDPDGKDSLIIHRSAGKLKGQTMHYTITFSVIKNGVEEAVMRTVLKDGKEVQEPVEYQQAANAKYVLLPQYSDVNLAFRQMGDNNGNVRGMEPFKNTIRVRYKGYAIFFHPTNYNTGWLKGCLSTSEQLTDDGTPVGNPDLKGSKYYNDLKVRTGKVLDYIYKLYQDNNIGTRKGVNPGNAFFIRTNSRAGGHLDGVDSPIEPSKPAETTTAPQEGDIG